MAMFEINLMILEATSPLCPKTIRVQLPQECLELSRIFVRPHHVLVWTCIIHEKWVVVLDLDTRGLCIGLFQASYQAQSFP